MSAPERIAVRDRSGTMGRDRALRLLTEYAAAQSRLLDPATLTEESWGRGRGRGFAVELLPLEAARELREAKQR